MDCIITLNIGTSAVKLIAYDLNGNEIANRKGTYPTFHEKPNFSEQDPEQVFITVLFVLKGLLNDPIFTKKHTVISIVLSSAMHTVLCVDNQGIPIGNAMIWADNRANAEAKELDLSNLGSELYFATGTPIHPMSPLVKIAWIKNKEPERFKKTFKFISLKEYIIFQLTGQYVIDYSLASATGLFNIHSLTWETNALDYAGINSSNLSDAKPIYFSDLKLLPELAKSLKISIKTRILIGSSDGCFSTIGSGVVRKGQAIISITSSSAVRVASKEIIKDENKSIFNYILDKDHYVSGGPSNNGAVAFDWFGRQFGDFKNGLDFEHAISDLLKDASYVKPGANGLLFLPYLLGERAPIWNSNARGVYFGININHRQKHFVRATVEGILFEIYSIGRNLQKHRNFETLCVNGFFATIPFCAQILADMFNIKVYSNHNVNSSNSGAALLALTDLGIYKNLDEAATSVSYSEIYEPNIHNNIRYEQFYEIFEKLSQKLGAEFEQIASLQDVVE